MNNEFEKILLANFDSAKKAFISECVKRNTRFQDEIISIDTIKGTLYISSMFQDYPEILIQDRNTENFLLSYSGKERAHTLVINKNRLNMEEESLTTLKLEDDKRSLTLDFVDETLNYLIFSFINYLMIAKNKASE